MSAVETVTPFAEIVEEIKEAGGEAYKYCYQCGKCDVVCPWNRVRDFSIRKIVWQANLGVPDIEREDIWRCTTCGSCPSHCPRGVEQIEVGVAIRRMAAAYGVFPGAVKPVRAVGQSLAADGNPIRSQQSTSSLEKFDLTSPKQALHSGDEPFHYPLLASHHLGEIEGWLRDQDAELLGPLYIQEQLHAPG